MCLAVPTEVIALQPGDQAVVKIGGIEKTISLALLEDVTVGDYVIVHVGHAIGKLDPEEAARTLALFDQLSPGNAAQALVLMPVPLQAGQPGARHVPSGACRLHASHKRLASCRVRRRSCGRSSGPPPGPIRLRHLRLRQGQAG